MWLTRVGLTLLVPGFVASGWACGSSTSDAATNSTDAASDTETSTDAAAEGEAGSTSDECTPRGWECQDTPTCEPNYQPMRGVSCGLGGRTCCIKGALPPTDASSD